MEFGFRREMGGRTWICFVALIFASHLGSASETAVPTAPKPLEMRVPVGETLSYSVSYMGVRCGEMEINNFVEDGADGESIYRTVVLARTTKFFDGIYRLRSRLDSFFDPRRMSSIRYEERSLEKKKRKDESWVVDIEAREVVRTKNGESSRIPVDVERAFDPLAFIFQLRSINPEIGSEMALGLMTSKGVAETVARVTEKKTIKTKMGPCDAVAVVPEPRDEMMFSKSGAMVIWIARDESRRPCKIEFDLSFGKLVASLKASAAGADSDVGADWENWDGAKGGGK